MIVAADSRRAAGRRFDSFIVGRWNQEELLLARLLRPNLKLKRRGRPS
jgi:hypothetical protein